MAKKIVDERSRAPVKSGNTSVDEMLVCQAKAMMRKLWPDEFDKPPVLRLIQGGRKS